MRGDAFATRYELAPMSRGIALLTGALLLLPAALLFLSFTQSPALFLPAGLVALTYLIVWLWFRPTCFELSGRGLVIVWPVRHSTFPLSQIDSAEIVTADELRVRYGRALRVGAGGLWGGFGLLLTRNGNLRFYISRLDRFVLVRLREEKPLLITPERADEFLRTLEKQLNHA